MAAQQPRQAAPLEELGERLHVAGDAGDQPAPPFVVVVGEAQLVDVPDQADAEIVQGALAAHAQPERRSQRFGGQHARQMRSTTCTCDDGLQAAISSAFSIGKHRVRHTVRRDDLGFKRHAKLGQNICRVLHGGPIAFGAHHNANIYFLIHFVSTSSASWYLAAVAAITSAGSAGAGAVFKGTAGLVLEAAIERAGVPASDRA